MVHPVDVCVLNVFIREAEVLEASQFKVYNLGMSFISLGLNTGEAVLINIKIFI